MFNRLHAQGCGNVGLTRSWSSHENHVVGILQELTAVQLPNQGFIDLAVAEVEARQVSIGREPCHLELIGHRAYLPFGGLGLEPLRQAGLRSVKRWGPLYSQFIARLSHAMHLELSQHADDGRNCWVMAQGVLPSTGHSAAHWPLVPPPGARLGGKRPEPERVCHRPICAERSGCVSCWEPRPPTPAQLLRALPAHRGEEPGPGSPPSPDLRLAA